MYPEGHTGKCAKRDKKRRAKAAPAADSKGPAVPEAAPASAQKAGSMQGGPEHAPGRPGSAGPSRVAALKQKSLAEVNSSSGTSVAVSELDSEDVPLQTLIDKKAAEVVDSQAQPEQAAKALKQAEPKQSAKRPNQAQPEPPAKRARTAPKGSDSESYSPAAEEQGAEPAKKKVHIAADSLLNETCKHSGESICPAESLGSDLPCPRAFCDHRGLRAITFCTECDA